MAVLSPVAKQQFFDNDGNPAAGYLLYTYATGTSTPLATYSDKAGTVANANPVVLDARGEAIIYLLPSSTYDYVLKTTVGATVWTRTGVDVSIGDAAAVTFLQAGAGAVSRSLQDKARERISIADYGSVADTDSAEASTATIAAFAAAITEAAASGKDISIPAGGYWITADNGVSTGLTIDVPDNTRIRFVAEKGGAVIKRRAAATLASTSGLVFMVANTGVEIEWDGITFDGNEANCQYDAGLPYDEEQSANIKWLTGTGTPKALRFFDCDVGKNRVGDGYHANIRVDHFMASDCSTSDTSVRRVRADWQFSRYATYGTLMSNIQCNSWESEPADTQATAFLQLSNVNARSVFDLAGDTGGTTARPIRAILTNVVCEGTAGVAGLPFVNFWRVHGEAHGCHFSLIDRIQRCKLKFVGGSIQVQDAGAGVADAVQIWNDQIMEGPAYAEYTDRYGNYVTFDGVTFKKDSTVTTGQFLVVSTTATAAGMFGDEMVSVTIRDCHTPEPLDFVIEAGRAGQVEVSGGKLRANTAIVHYANDGSFVNHLHVSPTTQWDAPALIKAGSSIDVAGSHLSISGAFNAEAVSPIDSGSVTTAPLVTWRVDAIAHVASDPNARIKAVPGLVAKLNKPVRGKPVSYRASYTVGDESGYGGTVWEVLDQSVLTGSKTHDWLNLVTATQQSTTVTVVGAAVGDHVDSVSHSAALSGTRLWGEVTAADTVTVYQRNDTGADVDVASGTLRVRVRKA